MIEIAVAIGLVLTLIAVLLGCYAAEGLELDHPRHQPGLWDERRGEYLSHDGSPLQRRASVPPSEVTSDDIGAFVAAPAKVGRRR
jgi:hypothetical protein